MFARRDYIRDSMMIPPGTGEAAVVNVIVEIPSGFVPRWAMSATDLSHFRPESLPRIAHSRM
ncbi:MAG: hypothetical protein L0241_01375 [Planctomycetia bacterium]|nr:hypothetical protein [Planctomycetia bacterium]